MTTHGPGGNASGTHVQHEAASSLHHLRPTAERYQNALHRYLDVVAGRASSLPDHPPVGAVDAAPSKSIAESTGPAENVRRRAEPASLVADVMTGSVVCAHEGAVFKEIVDALVRNGIAAVPVVDERRKVVGVVSGSDLLARVASEGPERPRGHRLFGHHETRRKIQATVARDLMTSPAITTVPDTPITDAARLAARHRVRRLPVVDHDGVLVGIVTRTDLLKAFLRPDEDIREEIVREIVIRTMSLEPAALTVEVTEGVVTMTGFVEALPLITTLLEKVTEVPGVVAVRDELIYRVPDRPENLRGAADPR